MSSKAIVVVYLADAECAAELTQSLDADGIEAIVAQSSDQFHRVVNRQRVDLVVLANELGGFLSGLEILERLFNDLLRPGIVLVGNLSLELQKRARGLGIENVLRVDSSVQLIHDTVKSVLATSKLSQVVIPVEARKLVQTSDVIAPLPQLIVKLCAYLGDESVSIARVAKDISVDPKITAELLKLTNSTSLGIRTKVTKVFDAVNFLGIRRTVSLVLSSSVIRMQSKLLKALPASFRAWYHSRSVLIASTACAFAGRLEDVSADSAFVLGLLQDIGILVLTHAHGARYLQTLDRIREIGQLRLEITEAQDFRLTHADVSAALLQKWDLPPSLISLVLTHHSQDSTSDRSRTEQRFLHVMQIGEAMANLSDHFSPQRHQILTQLLATYGEGKGEECKACLAEAVAKTAEAKKLFGVAVPEDDALNEIVKKYLLGPPPAEPEENAPALELESASAQRPERSAQPTLADTPDGTKNLPPSFAPTSTSDGPRHVILVIDDEQVVIKLIRKMLAPYEVEVLSCSNSRDAGQLAKRATLILCDVHVGDENGVQIARELKQAGFTGPLIMVSGDCTRQTVKECVEEGITGYLLKPFNRAKLVEKLQQHIPLETAATVN